MLTEILEKFKNKTVAMGAAAVLGTLLLAYAWIWLPTQKQMTLIEQDRVEFSKKAPLLSTIADAQKRFEKASKNFPKSTDTVKIIDELNMLAGQSQLAVLSIVPAKPARAGNYFEQVSVNIDAEGSYHAVGSYVSAIENLKYFTKIVFLEISGDQEEALSGTNLIPRKQKISLTVAFFYPAGEATL